MRAWTQTDRETASRAWGAPVLSGFCQGENRPGTEQKPGGLGMEFPRIFRFTLNFSISLPLVALVVLFGQPTGACARSAGAAALQPWLPREHLPKLLS